MLTSSKCQISVFTCRTVCSIWDLRHSVNRVNWRLTLNCRICWDWIVLRLCSCSLNLPTRRRQICRHSSRGSWTHWFCVFLWETDHWSLCYFFTCSLRFHHRSNAKLISEVMILEMSYCFSVTLLLNNFISALVLSQPHLRQQMICCCTVCVDCVVPALCWILIKATSSVWKLKQCFLVSALTRECEIGLALRATVVSVYVGLTYPVKKCCCKEHYWFICLYTPIR